MLCERLRGTGIDAHWWREESANHPIMPKARRALSRNRDFPDICLTAWSDFLRMPPHDSAVTTDTGRRSHTVVILDGYAFQSTVRLMFANQVKRSTIGSYFDRWQDLAPHTSIVFFALDNVPAHYDIILELRGDEWAQKLFAYVAQTPIGKAHKLIGKTGFIDFWSRYQELCLELLGTAHVFNEIVTPASGGVRDATETASGGVRGAAEQSFWNQHDLDSFAVRRGFL